MAELRGELSLETRDAEREIERLGPLFDRIVDRFSVDLAKSLEQLTSLPPIEADLSRVDSAIAETADQAGDLLAGSLESGAEDAADSIAEALSSGLADTGDELAGALESGAEGSADGITAVIESAVNAADTTIEVDADVSAAEAELDGLSDKAAEAGSSLTSEFGGGAKSAGGISDLATGSVAGLGSALGDIAPKAAGSLGAIAAVGGTIGLMFNEAVEARGAAQRFSATLGDMADEVENLRSIEGLDTNLSDLALTLGSDDEKVRNVVSRLFELASASGKTRTEASLFTQQLVAMGARAVASNPQLGDLGDVTDGLSTALVRGGRFASKYGLDLSAADINARALKDTNKATTQELTFVEKAMAGAALATEKYGSNLDTVITRGSKNAITQLRSMKQQVIENIEALGTPLIAPIFELMREGIPVARDVGRIVSALAVSVLPAFIAAVQILAPLLELVAEVLERIPAPLLAAGAAFILFRKATVTTGTGLDAVSTKALSASDKIGRIAVGVGLAITSFQQIGGSAKESAVGIAGMAASGALIGSAFGNPALGAAAGVLVGIGKAALGGGESVDAMRKRVQGLASELDGLSERGSATRFVRQLKVGADDLKRGLGGALVPIGAIRRELSELSRTSPAAAARVVAGIRSMGASSGLTERQIASLQRTVDEGSVAYTKAAERKSKAVESNQALIKSESQLADAAEEAATRSKEAFDSYIDALAAGVPDIDELFSNAIESVEDWQAANAPEKLIENLAKQTEAVTNFQTNLAILVSEGLLDLAADLAKKGPFAAGQVAQAFVNSTPETRRAADAQTKAASDSLNSLDSYIRNNLAGRLGEAGRIAGYSVPQGVAQGISEGQFLAELEAAEMAYATEQAARNVLETGSPSKLFKRVGQDVSEGFAVGIDDGVERFVSKAGERLAMRPVPGAQGGGDVSTTNSVVDNSFHAFEGATLTAASPERFMQSAQSRLRAVAAFRAK